MKEVFIRLIGLISGTGNLIFLRGRCCRSRYRRRGRRRRSRYRLRGRRRRRRSRRQPHESQIKVLF